MRGLLIMNGWHIPPSSDVHTAATVRYTKRSNHICASRAARCNFSEVNGVHGLRCAESCGFSTICVITVHDLRPSFANGAIRVACAH